MKNYRHGDLAIKPLKELPQGLKKLNSNIVMSGEATGHHHRLLERTNNQFSIMEDVNGNKYLQINEPTDLVHEEHKTITIEKGIYLVDREEEYDYFEETIKQVQD